MPGFGGNGDDDNGHETVRNIGGNPSAGSRNVYASADLKALCVDNDICEPSYAPLSGNYLYTSGQDLLDATGCNYDYDPNLTSTFVLNRVDGSINGLQLLFSKEDLFFLAWESVRHQINPYFLMGILSQESAGNCSAVSASHGEGCFQITNTFGQAQLDESYSDRVASWFWTDRSGTYYPDDVFIDELTYFGSEPASEQYRLTLDPSAHEIEGVSISSVANFNFGIIAAGLYFHWQPYFVYENYSSLRDELRDLFQTKDGKSSWQAAAYNGGITRARQAIGDAGNDFLNEMREETQDYVPSVLDYCHEYEAGELTYSATYTQDEVEFIIDLLSYTYPNDSGLDWEAVKDDVHQVFFEDGTEELTFVDDVKALVYVISTHAADLGPEWAVF